MTAKPLTDTQIRALKPREHGQVDIADVRSAGLFLRVTSAAKTWCFRFTDPNSGKRLRMTLAKYPDLGLSEARERADGLRRLVANGTNPIEQRQQQRAEASSRTFEALARRYLTDHANRFKRTADADDRNLRLHILPRWGKRNFAGIRRADIIELIEGLISDGKPALANRVQALISKLFSFAVDADLVEANPAVRLRKRGKEEPLTRVLDDDEIRLFWSKIAASPLLPSTGIALKLALLTGLRAGELAGIHRTEIINIHDPDVAAILLPEARVKNKRDFLVPLSPMARELVAQQLAGDAAYLFPSRHDKDTALDPHAMAKAMARFARSFENEQAGSDTWQANPPTPHDLRRTFATRLSALGVPKEDRDALLNHARGDVGSRHYDQYERQREKRIALNRWAVALAAIIDGRGAAIVPLRRLP